MTGESETAPRRPTSRDVRAIAVEALVKPVMQWAQSPPSEEDEIRSALIDAASDDAYEFAKRLDDRHGFHGCDYELVEILSGFSTYSARHDAVERWVSENNISIPYNIGEVVIARGQQARIVALYSGTAEIVVQPVMADGKNYGTTGGWVHAVEDVKPEPAKAAA